MSRAGGPKIKASWSRKTSKRVEKTRGSRDSTYFKPMTMDVAIVVPRSPEKRREEGGESESCKDDNNSTQELRERG